VTPTAAARYFIPVCLYPHTKYRTHAGVAALIEKYELRHHDHLIVVAETGSSPKLDANS
jgi:hypothetical protein